MKSSVKLGNAGTGWLSMFDGIWCGWGLAICISAVLCSPEATAQVIEVDSSGRQLDEILVVAQKKDRAENLQQVPISITAFPAQELDARFIQNLTGLSYTIPNVQMEEVGTFPGVQNFSISGQGINSSIPSVDPTVGLFIDGVYMGTTFGTVIDMWDLESVEVLRGPQGLLFGRNVTGGAVTVRSARPDPRGERAHSRQRRDFFAREREWRPRPGSYGIGRLRA